MHNGSMLRMRWFASHYIHIPAEGKVKILDVGGGDVNGTYRQIFSNPIFEYTSLDIEAGPNVDIVLPAAYDWSVVPTETYDVVICGQVFEHAEFFWLTMVEMVRVLRQGSLLCLILPSTYGYHRHPVDCYRFNVDSVIGLARYTSLNILHAHTNCAPVNDPVEKPFIKYWYGVRHIDTMLVAYKSYNGPTIIPDHTKYQCVPFDLNVLKGDLVPYFSYRERSFFFRLKEWLRIFFKYDPL